MHKNRKQCLCNCSRKAGERFALVRIVHTAEVLRIEQNSPGDYMESLKRCDDHDDHTALRVIWDSRQWRIIFF